MFGFIPVLVGLETQGETIFRIFRELPYRRHITQDLSEETSVNLDEIARYLRTLLHRTSIEAIQGNAQGLTTTLHYIRHIYESVIMGLKKMQEFMPRSLIKFYEHINELELQLAENKANYSYNANVISEIDAMEIFMENTREKILSFWEERPNIYIRLPVHLHRHIPGLFSSEIYLPYTMGKADLPRWLDPMIIEQMNESRKIEQSRVQTLVERKKYHKYIMLLTRTKSGISSEIVTMIVEYMPITFVFDLLKIMTPSQFSAITDCEKICSNNSISVYVS